MSKLFYILFLSILLFSCDCDSELFFDPSDLSKLSLDTIGSFWQGDTVKYSSYPGTSFASRDDYIDSIAYSSRSEMTSKRIAVSVFESQSGAIEAMEYRIDNVAASINEGESHDLIVEKWWYSFGAVFVNQWNTITEVSYYHPNFDDIKVLLMETANYIAEKIDSLSN